MKKVLAESLTNPNALVVEELGLEHGACRVDIAVVNGVIHGYELKSDADTLHRLPLQIDAYSRALDKATLVVSERHHAEAAKLLPSWWGIKVSHVGPRGAVHIETERAATMNPDISAFHVAHLLWRDEALAILEAFETDKRVLRGNKRVLYTLLAQHLSLSSLRAQVRDALKRRTNWRHPAQPS
ncbi:sce7726 family protein [Burkholderia latens]|uniref:sce7726 family protein n=1 Tax=Burkholderia latens TaxID=488446 RepID=UPI001AE943AA|nr:sce7726 family protein [Burkholderia latens]QTO43335.1 sce7726 family protein [Burkholderia latens]